MARWPRGQLSCGLALYPPQDTFLLGVRVLSCHFAKLILRHMCIKYISKKSLEQLMEIYFEFQYFEFQSGEIMRIVEI